MRFLGIALELVLNASEMEFLICWAAMSIHDKTFTVSVGPRVTGASGVTFVIGRGASRIAGQLRRLLESEQGSVRLISACLRSQNDWIEPS
jgi:hypothetical protein